MFLYSKTIDLFIKKAKKHFIDILENEVGLKFRRNRFEYRQMLIPFNMVVFEHPTQIGFFDKSLYQIGLSKKLITTTNEELVKNIIRHELAHLLCYLQYRSDIADHGAEFRNLCRHYSWGEEVYSAKINLEKELSLASNPDIDLKSQKVAKQIEKLLNLAKGGEGHEAEAATLKANELIQKYNLTHLEKFDSNNEDDEEICVLRVYENKRANQTMHALYEILQYFQVFPIFNRGLGITYLEIIGDTHNVKLADYMAKFLIHEINQGWIRLKKESPRFKGITAKNSYIRGWATGLVTQLKEQQYRHNPSSSKALVVLEKQLALKAAKVYPHIGSTSSSYSKFNIDAATRGAKDGHGLSLRKGLNQSEHKLLK